MNKVISVRFDSGKITSNSNILNVLTKAVDIIGDVSSR